MKEVVILAHQRGRLIPHDVSRNIPEQTQGIIEATAPPKMNWGKVEIFPPGHRVAAEEDGIYDATYTVPQGKKQAGEFMVIRYHEEAAIPA